MKTIKAIALSVAAVMLLSAVPTTAYAETRNDAFAESRLGDANLDGKVDVIDVSGVQLHAAGKLLSAEARPFADVNKDDLIDVTDATLIQLKVAGKIEF